MSKQELDKVFACLAGIRAIAKAEQTEDSDSIIVLATEIDNILYSNFKEQRCS